MAPKKNNAPKKSTPKDLDKVLGQLEKEKQEYEPAPSQSKEI